MAIVNISLTKELEKELDILNASQYEFYLGGSRRMAEIDQECQNGKNNIHISDYTDYDFYATYSSEVEQFLQHNGYVHTNTSLAAEYCDPDYLDAEAVSIYKNVSNTIQIVLRRDAEFYRTVFESITPEFYHKYLWKSSPDKIPDIDIKDIMNQLFRTAQEKNKC